jgi:hypothetical protein
MAHVSDEEFAEFKRQVIGEVALGSISCDELNEKIKAWQDEYGKNYKEGSDEDNEKVNKKKARLRRQWKSDAKRYAKEQGASLPVNVEEVQTPLSSHTGAMPGTSGVGTSSRTMPSSATDTQTTRSTNSCYEDAEAPSKESASEDLSDEMHVVPLIALPEVEALLQSAFLKGLLYGTGTCMFFISVGWLMALAFV